MNNPERDCVKSSRSFFLYRNLQQDQPKGCRTSVRGWVARGIGRAWKCQKKKESDKETSTYSTKIIKGMEFGGKSAVDTEELFVHDSCKRQRAEGFHAGIVDALRVLVLA